MGNLNLVFMQYNRVEAERGSSPTVREGLVQYKLGAVAEAVR